MVWRNHLLARAAVLALVPLAGCGAAPDRDSGIVNPDPKMDAVLLQPLLTDPDLSQLNRRNIAVEPGGPVDLSLPGPFPSAGVGG